MLQRSPEEAAKQKEHNKQYMRQLHAGKVNKNTEMRKPQWFVTFEL
jgi:hypothetical protein